VIEPGIGIPGLAQRWRERRAQTSPGEGQ
jgi:hypothetical protein